MADVIRTSNEQDINTALAWLEGPWQAAENRRGAANAAAVIRALRDAHETPPASNSNDMAAEFQRWLNAKGGDKGLMAAFYAGYMIAIRGSHETPELRFHEGERQSYLKAVELSVASGMLGDGDKSDLLDMYQRLWPRAPSDVRANALKALEPRTESILDRKVTVCASCLCANCWQGDFYCDNYKTASTVDKTVRELFQINANGVREDSGYWFKDVDTGKVDYYAKSAAKRAFNALSEPV